MKIILRTGIALLSLIVIIEILNITLAIYARRIMQDDLMDKVSQTTNGLYSLETGRLNVNLLFGYASLDKITLRLNPARLEELYREDSIPKFYASIAIQNIQVHDIEKMYWKWKEHKIYFGDFIINGISVQLPGNLYQLNINKIAINLNDSSLEIRKMAYQSKIPKWEFAYNDPKHSDWMDLRIENIRLKNVHIVPLVKDKKLLADSLLISGAAFGNYKNQKIPHEHNLVPMIYEQVQKIPLPFQFHYARVSDLNIVYEELAVKGKNPGKIRLTEMEGIFDNGFTNIVTSHTQTNHLLATGKFMNEGLINAEMSFPVDSTYDYATVKGTLGGMNMMVLNQIIEPLAAPARIRSGFIEGLDFNIVGGKEKATIDMCLRYKDLSADVSNPFLSLLLNGAVRRNNPAAGQEPLRVQVEHIRDPYHSSFNYLWKIYFAGICETVGYTQARQKEFKWIQENLKRHR
jgi:hypothetical protein